LKTKAILTYDFGIDLGQCCQARFDSQAGGSGIGARVTATTHGSVISVIQCYFKAVRSRQIRGEAREQPSRGQGKAW